MPTGIGMRDRAISAIKPDRTSLYREATWLAIGLRWLAVLIAASWAFPRYGVSSVLASVVIAIGVLGLSLTVLHTFELHPPLWLISLLDLTAISALVMSFGGAAGLALFAYSLLVLVLTVAYRWKGAILGLTFYLVGESAILLATGRPEAGVLAVRIGALILAALVLSLLVDRHESLRLRLARAAVDHPQKGVHDLQEFTTALEFLHKLAVRGKWPYSVMVVDIRRPGVNAGYQEAGIEERILRQLTAEARASLRSTDILGRVGADVLAIAMPDTPERGAVRVARRIEERLRQRAAELEFFVGLAEMRPSRKNAYDECLHSAFASARESKAAHVS